MVRPNMNNKKPYRRLFDPYNWDRPPVPAQQEVQRPERPETPSPPLTSSLRFLTLRRNRMHKISGGLIHVHKNGLRTRMPTCPANATCVGIDDIGEYMYNQAKKCKHLMEEANRMKDANQPPFTEQTPNSELFSTEQGDNKINVVVEIGPAQSGVVPQNCWDLPANSELP